MIWAFPDDETVRSNPPMRNKTSWHPTLHRFWEWRCVCGNSGTIPAPGNEEGQPPAVTHVCMACKTIHRMPAIEP